METRILITNDDGIGSPALDELEQVLQHLGDLTIVAPDREMSAQSHSITVNQPLRYRTLGSNRYAVDGTPADCVILALLKVVEEQPDLLISGINRGKNVGDGVLYSGTLAAASEGALQGIPSLAVSVESLEPVEFGPAADFTAVLANKVLKDGLPPGVVLNVNFPRDWNGKVLLTRQGHKSGKTVLVENVDPTGEEYFWLQEELQEHSDVPIEGLPADNEVLAEGYASITPIQLDRTAFRSLKLLSTWSDIFEAESLRETP